MRNSIIVFLILTSFTAVFARVGEIAYQPGNIDEDAAINIVNALPQIEELRATNPDVRIVFTVTETPEEGGRWAIIVMTDQDTHYSNVGIFYVYPNTGEVTRIDPLTGGEVGLDQ